MFTCEMRRVFVDARRGTGAEGDEDIAALGVARGNSRHGGGRRPLRGDARASASRCGRGAGRGRRGRKCGGRREWGRGSWRGGSERRGIDRFRHRGGGRAGGGECRLSGICGSGLKGGSQTGRRAERFGWWRGRSGRRSGRCGPVPGRGDCRPDCYWDQWKRQWWPFHQWRRERKWDRRGRIFSGAHVPTGPGAAGKTGRGRVHHRRQRGQRSHRDRQKDGARRDGGVAHGLHASIFHHHHRVRG